MLLKRGALFCARNGKLENFKSSSLIAHAGIRPVLPSVTQITFEWPVYPDLQNPPIFWKLKNTLACFVVGMFGKAILSLLNTTKINNLKTLTDAIFRRPPGVPLITVSNHESCLDDPCLISVLMTNRELLQQNKMRWGLAASDVCYTKKWHGKLMGFGKCLPIVRGGGVYQRAMDFSIDRLNHGDWLHVFPEGKVNMERRQLHRLKWGIGRIISELNVPPIVIPFWHTGMSNVLPNYPPYYPRVGNKVFINIGKPIDLSSVLSGLDGMKAVEKRKIITDFIQVEMEALREATLLLAKENGFNSEPEDGEAGDKSDGIA